ncbi:MAG: branched-chain amino acid ABC transporter permease [Alphaproteobacteria bacterium]|nr:branched-chain amino acid ABC transporter permease [Alphaproteobacteria bacterium]
MEDALTLILAGISVGSVYALIAIGLNLTYWTTRTMNFGQGSVMMLGAMMTAVLVAGGVIDALAALASLVVIAAIMVFTEVFTVRPALKIGGSMGWAVSTLGVGIILQGVAAKYFGSQAVAFPDMVFSAQDYVEVFGVRFALQYLAILVLSVALVALLELLLRRTVWGRAMRAVSMDADLAAVAGIPVRPIVLGSYIASGLLAGIAGMLIAQTGGTVDPAFGFDLMIFGFVAAVLGGIGSSSGALLGGLVLGVIEKLVGGYVSTAAAHGIAFALLVVVLVARPQGLFGQREVVKV